MNKNKWTPSVPVKPKNLIISSKAVAENIRGFTPSCEKECGSGEMGYLLSMEYQKRWFEERTEHEKTVYQEGDIKPDIRNRKKYIPKPKPKKNVRVLPVITLQRFQNIPSKTDHRR